MTASSDVGVRSSASLLAQGWVRRYLADPARAREAQETYTAAGFEVHLETLAPSDFGAKCQGCAAAACRSYVVVYTRKKSEVDQ